MNTLTWVCSKAMDWSRPTTNTASTSDSVLSQQPQTQKAKEMDPMDYLATRFEENQSELRKLRDELAQAKADLSSSRSQINEQKDGIAAAVKRTENQRHQIRGVNEKLAQTVKEMNSLRRENVELRTFTKNQAATVNNIRAEMLHEEAKRKDSARGEQHALAAQKELQTRLAEVQSRLSEALFEIEHFKCIEAPVLKIKRDLLPQPFVLVLVDGDAYGWANTLFRHDVANHSAGALAASELQTAVLANVSNNPSVSPTCKIITRIFFNEHGKASLNRPRHNLLAQAKKDMITFRRHFTQTMPLFDFFDVGTGKERADQKLRANFDLFLSNPQCQHIFLAVCTDNGFARMLEPHRYTPAMERITLVSPGYVCREIEELALPTVEWKSVFKAKKRPFEDAEKETQLKAKLQKEIEYNAKMGFAGTVDERVAAYVKDIVPGCDKWVEDAINTVRRKGLHVGRAAYVPAMKPGAQEVCALTEAVIEVLKDESGSESSEDEDDDVD